MELKNERRGRIAEYVERFSSATWSPTDSSEDYNAMWCVSADAAFPSATQNEINSNDARHLIEAGVGLVSEGANMPTTPEAQDILVDAGVLLGPGKAANAGGVAVSALEMAQASQRQCWSTEDVDRHLRRIMCDIHGACLHAAKQYGFGNDYRHGANIAGFRKVADAMIDQGLV